MKKYTQFAKNDHQHLHIYEISWLKYMLGNAFCQSAPFFILNLGLFNLKVAQRCAKGAILLHFWFCCFCVGLCIDRVQTADPKCSKRKPGEAEANRCHKDCTPFVIVSGIRTIPGCHLVFSKQRQGLFLAEPHLC